MNIVVNGKEVNADNISYKVLSYAEIVALAFSADGSFAVAYKEGTWDGAWTGNIAPGQCLRIYPGMIFEIVRTDVAVREDFSQAYFDPKF